jgi:hypothetical protein
VIGVDSNAKNSLWNSVCSDKKGVELEGILLESKLNILNRQRWELDFIPGGTSFLDITLGTDDIVSPRWFFPSIPSLSDHPYIYFEILRSCQFHRARPARFSTTKLPHISNLDPVLLRQCVSRNLPSIPPLTTYCTKSVVDDTIADLVSVISSSARKAKKSYAVPRTRHMPWWSTELCAMRNKTRLAFKLWSVLKTPEHRGSYSRCKADYQRELRRAKSLSWQQMCSANPSGPELFSTLKLFAGKSNSVALPPSITVNGEIISDPGTVIDSCASHLFPREPPSLPSHTLVVDFVSEAILGQSDTTPPPVTSWEVTTAIDSLNSKAAPGQDGLSMAIVKECFPSIKLHLLFIFNACFNLQYFPDCWKTAKVAIIGKPNKPDYDSLNSFRPISLVNNLAKILEKIILSRLQWHSSQLKWISPNQHGFSPGKSTESAGHALISFIEKSRLAKQTTAVAFLDIKSAFDAAWHPAILSSLIKRGCPLYLVRLVSCFLACRTAILSHNDFTKAHTVNLGCPQGGVLSPFLWAILIDDVLRLTFPFLNLISGYADDLTVASSHKIPEIALQNLQLMLNAISRWCSDSKLSLNALKTVLMIFQKQGLNVSHLSICINGVHIQPSPETVFLGFTLDSQLKWVSHLNAKALAARKAFFGVLSCLRASWGLDRKRIQFLYLTVVEPILLYGCSLWAPLLSSKTGIKKARSCQRIFLIATIGAFKTVSTEALLILNSASPIDLRVAEIAVMRFRACSYEFSPASLKWLVKLFPSIVSKPKIDHVSHFTSSTCPPWAKCLIPPPFECVAPMSMLPPASRTLRLLSGFRRVGSSFHFSIFIMDYRGIMAIESGSVQSSIGELSASQFCTNRALRIAGSTGQDYASVELFSSSASSFSFISPLSKLSSLQRLNRDCYFLIAEKTSLFTCFPSPYNPWFGLAYAAALLGGPCHNSTALLRPSKEAVKLDTRQSVQAIWAQEWSSSSHGAKTRAFFPRVKSAMIISRIHLSKQVIQILSGHSFLNSHQFRFGFRDSPACECGAPIESTEHFLFYCPRFSHQRTHFQAVCCSCNTIWPPSLPLIPENHVIWEAMCIFINRTRRLRRGCS